MSSNLLVGACITLGILGAWNTWTLHQVSKRLEVIEQMSSPESKVRSANISDTVHAIPDYQQEHPDREQPKKKGNRSKKDYDIVARESGSTQANIDLTDPEIQETIAKIAESNAKKKEEERRKSKMEAYKTSLKFELESFSEEKGYDTETVQSIETILDDSTAEWRAVREQVREGEISWIDARTEFKAIGQETEQKVTEFITAEDYKELQSRLWGDWGN